jgi:hypothetical protein
MVNKELIKVARVGASILGVYRNSGVFVLRGQVIRRFVGSIAGCSRGLTGSGY